MRSLSSHRLYACPRDARYSGSQVLRRWLCFLRLLLIEYQYNLPTFGADLEAGLSTHRDRPFRAVFQNTRLLILKARSCGPSPRKHNLEYHPRPTRSPGYFGSQRAPVVSKELKLYDFFRVSCCIFFTQGRIAARYSGNSTQAGDCRFRLLLSAQLSCLCPLPSCSNRTPKHGFFVT